MKAAYFSTELTVGLSGPTLGGEGLGHRGQVARDTSVPSQHVPSLFRSAGPVLTRSFKLWRNGTVYPGYLSSVNKVSCLRAKTGSPIVYMCFSRGVFEWMVRLAV